MQQQTHSRAAALIAGALVLLGAIGQLAAGFAPDLLGWSQTISTRSAETNALLIPGGGAFLIWLPLFAGAIAFAIYGLLPRQLDDAAFRAIALPAGIAYWANTIRSLYEPLYGPNWVSFLLLLAILVPLLVASMRAMYSTPGSLSRRLSLTPVFGQAGWISVATAAGFTQTAMFENVNPAGLDRLSLAIATLAVSLPVLLTLAWRLRSHTYALAAAWGLAWVAIVNFNRDLASLAVLALIGAVGVMLLSFGSRSASAARRSRK
ncbi:MAG: hypothetical protein AAGA95_18480 [Pseudomonadota bacterium]